MQRKKSVTSIESLPDELLVEILLHLPVEDIYDNAMLVCRRWSHMIRTPDFIHAHRVLHRSTTQGLLVRDYSCRNMEKDPLFFVAMRQGRIEVSEFNFKIRGNAYVSCNGLILEYHPSERALQITNPAIKQQFDVPPFIPQKLSHLCSTIAYSPVSMKYKVVRIYTDGDDGYTLRCAIATVGVDKSWRNLCTEHLSPKEKDRLKSDMIMTEGYIHWKPFFPYTHVVVTLNVETETFTQYPVPQEHVDRESEYLSTGKSVSAFVSGGYFSMVVWDMVSETGEWTKMYNIDLEAQRCKFKKFRRKHYGYPLSLIPAGWLRYQEVLVLCFSHTTRTCIAYNVITQEFDLFELGTYSYSKKFELHTKSLELLI